jgi:hypothetical protein
MTKFQALRELNRETQNVLTALNQAEASVIQARKLVDQNYQRKRMEIVRASDPSFDGDIHAKSA